ncbi:MULTISPECIES: 3-oxoacyl-ACP synthase [unclassified Crossiella]|uniref:3-oxoacyl-ACP synthase n=1 Tax=unclassified Crossiella TaxID=2620835 RepID=UPI001FFF7233|nr:MULTISPECIES: 3-oxoacyl-ACP synthase [unclassified Crossiella]MCK2241694.1 3-oxoacyl-ACP synthase [Crossiella sp. S99.2]MCK2255434.1 3-oxoacyl-ACP synthase [Crossiella sp. S99.1]
MPDPCLLAVAAELPPSRYTTDELLAAADGRLSDRLTGMLAGLGARAVRSRLAKAEVDPASIGLVLGVTSSPGRLLPSLVCDLFALLPEIPREAVALSLEYLGCSVIAKVVDTARWFLTAEPGKHVLVCFLDAITPLSPPLPGEYAHFSEVTADRRQDTVNAMHGFLFGDASVAMLLGADGDGPVFGPVTHLTNELPADAELGTVPDGGSDLPVVHGRRLYTLSAEVTPHGTHYATSTVRSLLATGTSGLDKPSEANPVLLHTGSNRILDGLCEEFGIDPDGAAVTSSYRVLREYGNTLGCSVPLMFADPVHRAPGVGLVVAATPSTSRCGLSTVSTRRTGSRGCPWSSPARPHRAGSAEGQAGQGG